MFSTDVFNKDKPDTLDWAKMGVFGIEMEAQAIYFMQKAGKKALSICTISDNVVAHQELLVEERSKNVDDLIVFCLETAISLE